MSSPAIGSVSADVHEVVSKRISGLSIIENSPLPHIIVPTMQLGIVQIANQIPGPSGQIAILKPKSYGTVSGSRAVEVEKAPIDKMDQGNGAEIAETQINSPGLSKLFRGNLLENFTVDNSTYSLGQIRATFYPKFENEKTDQEIRTRMIEMVSKGLATLEVSLKHSGSLFMYAGHEGGAYAKNSFGNMYAGDICS